MTACSLPNVKFMRCLSALWRISRAKRKARTQFRATGKKKGPSPLRNVRATPATPVPASHHFRELVRAVSRPACELYHAVASSTGPGGKRSRPTPAGSGGGREQRVIATGAGIAVVARPFLGQSIGLADGRIQVDGQGRVAGSRTGLPGPGQQLAAHPVELTDVAPPEAAQEGAQGGWRLDRAAQGAGRPAGTQYVGVVDAVARGSPGRVDGRGPTGSCAGRCPGWMAP